MNKQEREAIITANEYMGRLIQGIEGVSEKIYGGDESEGIAQISEIAEGIEYIYTIVRLTGNVFGKVEDVHAITPFLNEIVEALENKDYILVGDLYKYEIVPILEDIKSAFVKSLLN